MIKKAIFDQIFCDITDTNPNGVGHTIYNADMTRYGFLQTSYHQERTKPLARDSWQEFRDVLRNRLEEDLEPGSFEVVVAAFLSQNGNQRLPERESHVLGSYSKEAAIKQWERIQFEFQNWPNSEHPIPSQEDSAVPNAQEDSIFQDLYSQLPEYCSIHQSHAGSYGTKYPPRVDKIIDLLQKYDIDYVVDSFDEMGKWYHNIMLPGSSKQLFTAHHDVFGMGDSANDNSCSIFNLIALKMICPEAYIVFTDAEEIGPYAMYGAHRVADIWHESKKGNPVSVQNQSIDWKDMKWIVNLELTGSGGKRFFYGSYAKYRNGMASPLAQQIHHIFDDEYPVQEVDVPLSDSKIFVDRGIDSLVLNPLPPLLPKGKHRYSWPLDPVRAADGTMLDFSIVSLCNSPRDRLDLPYISTEDMQEFVEEVLLPIAMIC